MICSSTMTAGHFEQKKPAGAIIARMDLSAA
jgi:hypothetical protein